MSIKYSTKQPKVKKTPVDYVAPFNHLPVPQAFEFATAAWYNKRLYGVIELAMQPRAATQGEIARKLETDQGWLSRLLKQFKEDAR